MLTRPLELARLLRHFLAYYASVPEEPTLRQEQASILLSTVYLFATLGSGSATLFSVAFRGWESGPISIAYSIVLALYGVLILNSLRWRRTQDHVSFIRSSVLILFCLGIAWGILVNLFGLRARLDQQGILIGLVMALVSAPMLGVPLSAALAFFAPISIACSIVIVFLIHPIEYVAVLSFLSFLVFATTGFISMNKIMMDRLVGRLELQREHEIVRVFLREYEEVSTDWLWETNTEHRLCNVAPRLVEALNVSAERLESLDLFSLRRGEGGSSSEGAAVMEAMRNRLAFRDRAIALATATGTRWLNVTGHPVHDDKGEFKGYRGIGSDITAARINQQRIEFMARHDGLTRLLSRPTFVAETDAVLSRQPERRRALLLIDLDDFKHVNDDLGHAAGDALLETVASRLQEQLQPDELAARIGGDEFALLIQAHDQATAAARANGLGLALQIEYGSGLGVPASASIGVAMAPEHGTSLDQLMRRADFALYAAKSQGKGVSRMFEMCMENAFLSRQRLLGELGTAIEQDQIFVEYQPITDISSGQLVSTEALVRWAHPSRGPLAAGSFVPAAEASDLIEPLGARVLRLACEAAMSWNSEIPVSVNLSPRQLRSGRFVPTLTECLSATGLPPARLILEVTETVFLDATSRITHQLDVIRAMGVRLVLDDFGTGFSSLTYLRRFEVDGIKIDASFVRDLPGSRKVGAIVRTIGRLASDMNIYVTAEGVETEEQLRWLRGNGIPFAQGFLLGRPGYDPVASMIQAAAERGIVPVAAPRTLAERKPA